MKIHTFENAGLGKAPFKCVGLYSLPSKSLLEANPEAYNNELRNMPKGFAIGACRYCGMPLMHNFLIISSDGNKFSVGCECVRKTGDTGLTEKIKKVQSEEKRTKAEAQRRAKYEARLQSERNMNGGFTNQEYWQAQDDNRKFDILRKKEKVSPLLKEFADRLQDGKNGFCDSVAQEMKNGNLPSGRGLDIALDILAKQCGRRNSKAYNDEYDRIACVFDSI